MSAKQNKEILSSAIDEYNKGNLERFYDIIDANHIYHAAGGVEIKGQQAFKQFDILVRVTFPDQQTTIEHMIAEGDMVSWRGIFRGTFKGKFKTIAPTGKKVELPSICIHRFTNGKIVETWAVRDMQSMLQQMGVG
jgi:predicted ester cyclase